MKKLIKGLIIAVSSTVLLGDVCAQKRLIKGAPLVGEVDHSEHINLWPVAYKSGSYTSVLWPVFDIDNTGWSVRPLYTREGSEHSVLYPISSWDSSDKDGWIFPLAWKNDDFSYAFPFWWTDDYTGMLLSGYGDNGGFLGPVYYNSDKDKTSVGIIPAYGYCRSRNRSSHNVVFGIISHISNDSDSDDHVYWLIPWLDYRDGKDFAKSVIPLYAYYKSSEGKIFLSPGFFAGWNDDGDLDFANVMGLIYHYGNNTHRVLGGALAYSNYQTETDYTRWVCPWYSSASGENYRNVLFPFYHYSSNTDQSQLLTPLFGLKNTQGEMRLNNLLGPLYIDASDSNSRQYHFMAPLSYFKRSKNSDDYTNWVFPWFNKKDGERTTNMLFPLFYHSKGKAEQDDMLVTPLFISGTNNHGKETFRSFLGPMLIDAHGLGEHYYSFAWPFFTYKKYDKSQQSNFSIFPFIYNQRNRESGTNINMALGTLGYDSSDNAWRIWPAFSYKQNGIPSVVNLDDNSFSILGSLGFKYSHYDRQPSMLFRNTSVSEEFDLYRHRKEFLLFFESSSYGYFPYDTSLFRPTIKGSIKNGHNKYVYKLSRKRFGIFNYTNTHTIRIKDGSLNNDERKELITTINKGDTDKAKTFLASKGVEVDENDKDDVTRKLCDYIAPMTERTYITKWDIPLLMHYEEEPGRDHFDILWHFYRRNTRGESVSRDIFPFIQYDTNPEKSTFSFMWRLLRYENNNGKHSGHFLFIPW